MMVSRRFAEVEQQEANGEQLDWARRALYRAQCNCPYWHGAFGGIYLPHLRNAVYNQMIAADNLLDQATGKDGRLGRGDGQRLTTSTPARKCGWPTIN